MLGENKNLKDTPNNSIKDTSSVSAPLLSSWRNISGVYTKTNKLITALYMVTDIMDKDEPMRLKLRVFGVDVLSDMASFAKGNQVSLDEKISVILSFLGISFDMGMISEMNFNILQKEFIDLRQSIIDLNSEKNNYWLKDFMLQSNKVEDISTPAVSSIRQNPNVSESKLSAIFPKGQTTRIGVQKGGTLLKALSAVGEKHPHHTGSAEEFESLKNKRRAEIISIIKEKKKNTGIDGATITDIKNGAKETLVSCGEKTLQRELVSMVSDNILYRTGSKRWSHYFLK